jgi:hypothetical protein
MRMRRLVMGRVVVLHRLALALVLLQAELVGSVVGAELRLVMLILTDRV